MILWHAIKSPTSTHCLIRWHQVCPRSARVPAARVPERLIDFLCLIRCATTEAKDALGVLPARSRVLASSSGGIGFKSMLAEADDKPKLDLMAYASSSEDERDPAVDQDPAQPAAQPSVMVAASERPAAAAESKVSKPLARRSRSPSPRGNGKRDRSNRDDHRRRSRSRSRSRSNDRHRGGSSRHRSKRSRSKSRSRSPRDRRDRRRVSRSPSRSRSRSKDRRRRS